MCLCDVASRAQTSRLYIKVRTPNNIKVFNLDIRIVDRRVSLLLIAFLLDAVQFGVCVCTLNAFTNLCALQHALLLYFIDMITYDDLCDVAMTAICTLGPQQCYCVCVRVQDVFQYLFKFTLYAKVIFVVCACFACGAQCEIPLKCWPETNHFSKTILNTSVIFLNV